MATVELTLTNTADEPLVEVKIGAKVVAAFRSSSQTRTGTMSLTIGYVVGFFCLKNLAPGTSMHDFPGLASLPAGATRLVSLGVDFGDSTQGVQFDLMAGGRPVRVALRPPLGELIRPVVCSETHFLDQQGTVSSLQGGSPNMSQLWRDCPHF